MEPTGVDLVGPAEFIPLLEESQLIGPVGRWVVQQACAAAVSWPAGPGGSALRVSVHVSPLQLTEGAVIDNLPTARLILETVAEGIETVLEAAEVSMAGCDLGQGFLFARPMSRADVGAWLSGQHLAELAATTAT